MSAGAAKPKRRERLSPEVRRGRILDVAAEAFAEHGYSVSFDELAGAAGVTRTLLYHYFPSKLDLFRAVYEAEMMRLMAHAQPILEDAPPSTEARVRLAVEAAFGYADVAPASWRILFVHLDDYEPEVVSVQSTLREMVFEAGAGLIAEDLGELGLALDTMPGKVAAEIGFHGVAVAIQWWLEHPDTPREDVIEAAFRMLWMGLRGPD